MWTLIFKQGQITKVTTHTGQLWPKGRHTVQLPSNQMTTMCDDMNSEYSENGSGSVFLGRFLGAVYLIPGQLCFTWAFWTYVIRGKYYFWLLKFSLAGSFC